MRCEVCGERFVFQDLAKDEQVRDHVVCSDCYSKATPAVRNKWLTERAQNPPSVSGAQLVRFGASAALGGVFVFLALVSSFRTSALDQSVVPVLALVLLGFLGVAWSASRQGRPSAETAGFLVGVLACLSLILWAASIKDNGTHRGP